MKRLLSLMIAAVVLSGCGSLYSYRSGGEAATQASAAQAAAPGARALLQQVFRRPAPRPGPAQVLTPDVLAQINQPFLLVFIEKDGQLDASPQWGGFAEAGFNGDVVTWVEESARTMSLTRAGIVVATRGFGRDLMTLSADQLETALARRGQARSALRVHRTLDGENDVVTTSMVCRITLDGRETVRLLSGDFATQRMTEACLLADGGEVVNRYWLDVGSSTIRQSEQWLSPELGRVKVQRLK